MSLSKVIIPPLPEGGGGYTVLRLSILPSVQDIFRRIFLTFNIHLYMHIFRHIFLSNY